MIGRMATFITLFSTAFLLATQPLPGQDQAWTKELKDPAQRGTLHDAWENVRGDSGKWNDEPRLQHAPPLQQKAADLSLDDWADQLLKKEFQVTSREDHWLLFRTRQLDDNDRVWIERVERQGTQFTVVVSQAIWQGRYQKNFTYYGVLGVNLGKLAPDNYQVKWVVKELAFRTFAGTGQPRDNWPKDERPTDHDPAVLSVSFTVVDATR